MDLLFARADPAGLGSVEQARSAVRTFKAKIPPLMKLRIWTIIACVLGITSLAAGQIPGLDAADQETRLTLTSEFQPKVVRRGEVIEVTHRVTLNPGWHIYGRLEESGQPTTMAITDLGGLVALGPADIPIGDPHEQYGMHSYYLDGEVVMRQRFAVPFDAALGKGKVSGKIEYLACDASNCDQPTHAAFTLDFEVEDGAPRKDFARKKVEILALQLEKTTRRGEAGALELHLEVMPGYHIYGSKESGGVATSLIVTNAEELEARGVTFGAAVVPEGVPHDANGFVTYDLTGKVTLRLPFTIAAEAKAHDVFEAKLQFDYQVCDEKSCDMPASVALTTSFPVEGGDAREDRASKLSDATTQESGPKSGQAPTGKKVTASAAAKGGGAAGGEDSLWQLVALAFGGALFALAMPCTYPMIPITISFFTKQAEARGGKVLPLALVYGAGIVLMFVVIAAVLSNVIVPFAAHWITNLVIGVAFIVFALSLFGVIDLQPPRFLMNAAGKASTHGGYVGVFLMGATLVISSFTCTAPFVGNILAVGAQGGRAEAMLGMGIFGVVMATPFVLLALVPGAVASMPRSGQWMNTLKVFLGFVEVAAALKFLSNVELVLGLEALPREHFLFLWAAIFAVAAAFLFGMIRYKGDSGEVGGGRLVGGIVVVLLATYFATGAFGNRLDWVMESIAPGYSKRMAWAEAGSGAAVEGSLADARTIMKDDYDAAREVALRDKKLLFVNFTGVI